MAFMHNEMIARIKYEVLIHLIWRVTAGTLADTISMREETKSKVKTI
jgi:hypothetical protein